MMALMLITMTLDNGDDDGRPHLSNHATHGWQQTRRRRSGGDTTHLSSSPHKESLQPTTASEYGASKQNEAKAHIQHLKALKQLWRKCFVVTAPLFVSKQPIIKAD